jgi:hypothetical protein
LPTRFCNLTCGFCNEFEKVSESMQLKEMYRQIDHLGRLGAAMIGISGGEPPIRSHQESKPASANPWGQLWDNFLLTPANRRGISLILCPFIAASASESRFADDNSVASLATTL